MLDPRAVNQMDTQGYLIVRKPETIIARYDSCLTPRQREWHQQLSAIFTGLDRSRYRGISREPLYPYNEKWCESAGSGSPAEKANRLAKTMMWNLLSPFWDPDDDYQDMDLFPTLQLALAVLQHLDEPVNWEIIGKRRNDFGASENTLGFDVGYWGGDHFSLIADTIITPAWHPPPPEDFQELKDRFGSLNPNLLFSTPEDAARFREYYLTKSWAETEDIEGEFAIIQVERVFTSD